MTAASTQPEWVFWLDRHHLLTPLRVLLIVVVAWVLTLVVRAVVQRVLRRSLVLTGAAERERAEARQRALATALRSSVVGIIWASAVITVIGEVGINIGAFVATATVVGGAVAFGAQQLVRDLISGFFVLAEDQYGVGDQVDVGHATGVVERITLRSVRMRDGHGGVWHVPHGGVLRVANLSKASLALLDIEVSRSMSLAELDQQAHRLCAALAAHPLAGPKLIGVPTPVGLVDVHDDRLVYRLSASTEAGQQDGVRRTWRGLVVLAFEAGDLVAPNSAPTTTLVQLQRPESSEAETTDGE